MALLDMARKSNSYIKVAHVNYHKRDTAIRDEKIVRKYCRQYGIKFHKLDVYPENVKGNFQKYARDARYDFFKKLVINNKLDGVLVAHHMDDFIETYLLQKQKKIGVNYYGIAKYSNIKDTLIIRPLLKYQKSYLVNYCISNDIPFGIDESNLENHYSRNKVRHSVVDKMSYKDKLKVVKEINELNNFQQHEIDDVLKFLSKEKYSIMEFVNYKYFNRLIRYIFDENLSNKFIDDIKNKLSSNKNIVIKRNCVYLVKEYDYIEYFYDVGEYSYTFNSIVKGNYEFFKISDKGSSFEGAYVSKEDFPITIRNYKQGDSIAMRYGTKKINRFFIDNKIAYKDRLTWPIVFNNKGTAILVPKIGCNFNHYSKKENLYVIKL